MIFTSKKGTGESFRADCANLPAISLEESSKDQESSPGVRLVRTLSEHDSYLEIT